MKQDCATYAVLPAAVGLLEEEKEIAIELIDNDTVGKINKRLNPLKKPKTLL